MEINYLLPNKYKTLGWMLFIVGIIAGIIFIIKGYETNLLTTKVISVYDGLNISVDGKTSLFNIQENSIVDELITIAIIIGGLIVGFSREKV